MLELIPPDLYKPLLDEFRRGWHMERIQAEVTAKRVGKASEKYARGIDGVGKLVGRIPTSAYHYWGQRLGYECWKDQKFVKEFFRDNPSLKSQGGATKLQVGYASSAKPKPSGIVDQFGNSLN